MIDLKSVVASLGHLRGVPILALLLLPVAINLFKVSYAAYVVLLEDFGRYSLYVGFSSALVYLFNSGLYEGHLKYFSTFHLSRRFARIKWLQARGELASFCGLIAALALAAVILMVFHVSEPEFFLAMIISAHVQAHSNLITARARVENYLVFVGMTLTLRSLLSALLFVGLIAWQHVEIGKAYLIEGACVTIAHGIYLATRTRFSRASTVVKATSIARMGVSQCYASSIRNALFALERFTASLLLSPAEMGAYGRILLVYQVMVVGGGIVAQLYQQKILYSSLSGGVRQIGLNILKHQSIFIIAVGCLLLAVWVLVPTEYFRQIVRHLDPGVKMWGLMSIVLAGVIMGTSLIDSLALGSPHGLSFVGIQIVSGVIWCAVLMGLAAMPGIWSMNMQALMFLAMVCFLFLGNIRFIYLH